MTEKEYRSLTALSKSSLWEIRRSPQHFKYLLENPQVPTPAMVFGQLVHCAILQPEAFEDDFVIEPQINRRTSAGKEEYAEFEKLSAGKAIVSEEQMSEAWALRSSVYGNAIAKSLLTGEHEKPFFWNDNITHEACKCRVDGICEIGGQQIIIDLKTCSSAANADFIRDALKYGYDVQAAMYTEGVKDVTKRDSLFVFIAVEKSPPYAVNIIQADKEFMRCGWSRLRDLMAIYHNCRQSENWYGYLGENNIINETMLPAWAAKEIE